MKTETEDRNLIRYLERHRRERPERIALRWVDPRALARWNGSPGDPLPHEELRYADLAHLLRVTAHGLAELGIGKGDRVVLFVPMGVEMYTAMFAIQSLGAVAVFLDSWARRDQLAAVIRRVGPVAMISRRSAFVLIDDLFEAASIRHRIVVGSAGGGPWSARLEDLMQGNRETESACPVTDDDPALVTFTTGSSGTPKGANRTHGFLTSQHVALDRVIPYAAADRDLPAFPIFSLNNLASGVTTILPAVNLAAPSDRDPAALTSQILHEGITCATLSPSMVAGLSRFSGAAGIELPGLRRVVTGGAPISRDDIAAFARVAPNAEVLVLYGSTEVEPMAHVTGAEMLNRPTPSDPEIVERGVNVGRLVEGLDSRFLRIERGPIDLGETPWEVLEVSRGEVGELVVAGEHVCPSYWNDDEAMRRTKIRDGERVWHRTGDLAYRDDEESLWIVGRVHNVVEREGRAYFPVQAEVVLKRVPGVGRGAFLGLSDPRRGHATAVVVELEPGARGVEVAEEAVRLLNKNGIPVDSFHVVPAIPLDPRHHSKVKYDELRRMLLEPGVAAS
jgi:acyl-CoA synthetase (AMP-forming)/AMP-acid ligase II